MPEQTEWGIELPATPANGEYREPMGEARKAGLEARNATRLERAQQRTGASEERVRTVREAYQAAMRASEDGLPWNNPWAAVVAALDAYDEPATKALAETATELGRRLGHAEAADIADALAAGVVNPEKVYNEAFIHACGCVARAIREAS